MNYGLAILAGLAGALLGAAVGFAAGTLVAPLFGITSFEGASGYFVVLGCIPIGAMAGFILGAAWAVRRQGAHTPAAMARPLGVIIGTVAAILGGIYWYLFVKVDRLNPDGRPPQLVFEIRLPPGGPVVAVMRPGARSARREPRAP